MSDSEDEFYYGPSSSQLEFPLEGSDEGGPNAGDVNEDGQIYCKCDRYCGREGEWVHPRTRNKHQRTALFGEQERNLVHKRSTIARNEVSGGPPNSTQLTARATAGSPDEAGPSKPGRFTASSSPLRAESPPQPLGEILRHDASPVLPLEIESNHDDDDNIVVVFDTNPASFGAEQDEPTGGAREPPDDSVDRGAIGRPDQGSLVDMEQEDEDDEQQDKQGEDTEPREDDDEEDELEHLEGLDQAPLEALSSIPVVAQGQRFIHALKSASLDDSNMSPDAITRLRAPQTHVFDPTVEPNLRWSIDLFLGLQNASEASYDAVRTADMRRPGIPPEQHAMSYYLVRRRIEEISGVSPILHDMCINSCIAYTGPDFSDLDECPYCEEPRYDPQKLAASGGTERVARQHFSTIPIGPQIQARYRHPESAAEMRYRREKMAPILEQIRNAPPDSPFCPDQYDDVYLGSDLLEALASGRIKETDTILMYTTDGAQLYKSKQSECWIQLWVLLDISPLSCYKKPVVITGCSIPGPNNPKNLDSFLYPGLQHLAAIQLEGLPVWDASTDTIFIDHPFLAFVNADTVAMALLDGMVGHQGRFGCRYFCNMPCRHKAGSSTYYPAALRPRTPPGECLPVHSSHQDFNLRSFTRETSELKAQRYRTMLATVIASRTQTLYRRNRAATGIVKPSIFSGIPRSLGVPALFTPDVMHLMALNLGELFFKLWRGTMDCDSTDDRSAWSWRVLTGENWKAFGERVVSAIPYFPGSFGRIPRNPVLKINSGYKATEYLFLLFGLCPVFLHPLLPDEHWSNLCKLVAGVKICCQYSILPEELKHMQKFFLDFCKQFEEIYYCRMDTRIHFCRQSIHQPAHLAPETVRCGPLPLCAQWTMERAIGDLGQEVRQPSNPFANLAQRTIIRAQVNALKAVIPDLERPPSIFPRGSLPAGDGYVLLRRRDRYARTVHAAERAAIHTFYRDQEQPCAAQWCPKVMRWARLRLQNGQVARSAWKEKTRLLSEVRIARHVKIQINNEVRWAEVQYYFRLLVHGTPQAVAMVSVFDIADQHLKDTSHGVIEKCVYHGPLALRVIPVASIRSVVAMIPYDALAHADALREARGSLVGHAYFVLEKLGLEVGCKGGDEPIEDE